MIRLYLLGTTRVDDDRGVSLTEIAIQPRLMALLTYLAIARPAGPQRRDRLVGLFWGDLAQNNARGALRKAVHRLREALSDDAIVSLGADMLSANSAALWCDVTAFSEAHSDRRYREALDLYRGELLPGFSVADAGEFERWLEEERAFYNERALSAAWNLVEFYEHSRDFTSATQLARVVARLASTDERMLRRVLTMLNRLGDRAGAAEVYVRFADRLWREYETHPSLETTRLFESIQSGF